MYSGKMAFAIKANGKILREQAETVYLPFGSEYSLLIKNLNNRRALVRITIDGQEVVDGGLVVNANSSVDLERFVKVGQFSAGQRFKFIERTEKIENHRGVGLEDGLIRVEFEYEQVYQQSTYWYPPTFYGGGLMGSITGTTGPTLSSGTLYNMSTSASDAPVKSLLRSKSAASTASAASATSDTVSFASAESQMSVPRNDAGITVGGSISEQKFSSTSFTGDGVKTVMVIKMLGEVGEKPVEAPVTVKTQKKCPTCGHVNKAKAKFCTECGTGIEMWPGTPATYSNHQLGDFVICKGWKHQVKGVKFTNEKVIYSLAMATNLDGETIDYTSEDVYKLRDFEKTAADKM